MTTATTRRGETTTTPMTGRGSIACRRRCAGRISCRRRARRVNRSFALISRSHINIEALWFGAVQSRGLITTAA